MIFFRTLVYVIGIPICDDIFVFIFIFSVMFNYICRVYQKKFVIFKYPFTESVSEDVVRPSYRFSNRNPESLKIFFSIFLKSLKRD